MVRKHLRRYLDCYICGIAIIMIVLFTILHIMASPSLTITSKVAIAPSILVDGKFYYGICIDEEHFNNVSDSQTVMLGDFEYLLLDPGWFEDLWDSLNAKPEKITTPTHKPIVVLGGEYSWKSNPWVWVISYPKYSEELSAKEVL